MTAIPVVDYDPVRSYVDTLTRCYGSLAGFYYDKFGGTVVGVKVVSQGQQEKVKVHQLACKMASGGGATTNWGAVLEDWRILGEGLVREVQVVNTDVLL